MTKNETKNTEEMKRFLFHEMSESERTVMEERFFTDNELFYELVETENDLVDRYARGELGGADLARFEASLKKSPERREKLANAAALKKFVAEEKQTASVFVAKAETATFGQKIAEFFNFRANAFQLASAALVFLLVAATGFLLFERAKTNRELADLRGAQNGRVAELAEKEKTLEEQVRQSKEREQNLQNQIGAESGKSEILSAELESERAEKERLERELENLRREKGKVPETPKENAPPAPVIATIFLTPLGGKGAGGEVKTVRVKSQTEKISATLQLPKESKAETFTVKLEGALVGENVKARATAAGNRFVSVSFAAARLAPDKENLITLTGNDESRYNYAFRVQK